MNAENDIESRNPESRHAVRSLGFVLVLGLVSFVLPLLTARQYGALGIPRGDDWSYLQTLFRWVDHGRLDGNHWVSMTLLGQLGAAVPIVWIFGRSITAVQCGVAFMGFAGLLATYWMSVRVIGTGRAALVTLTIALGPLWGPLAASYMTDVPAFAATMCALALAVAALRRTPQSLPMVAASLAAGVYAFSIRQYAMVAVLAISMTVIWVARETRDRRASRVVIAMVVAAFVACGVIYAVWSEIPNLKSYVPSIPDGHSVSVAVIKGGGFVRLFGLLLAPVVAVAGPAQIVRRAWAASSRATLVTIGGLGVGLALLSVRVPGQQFVGNYIDSNGALSGDVLLGRRPDLFPSPVYPLLVILATVSGVLIVTAMIPPAARLVQRLASRDLQLTDPVLFCLGLTAVGYVLAYVFAMFTGVSVYDRYALPLLPLVGVAVARRPRVSEIEARAREAAIAPAGRVMGAVALAVVAAVGIAFTVDAASFDGTRWRVAVAVAHQGYARREINGGFEWVNYYRGTRVPRIVVGSNGAHGVPKTKVSDFCVSVYVDPLPDGRRVMVSRPYSNLTRSDARIVALRNPCRRR